MVLTAKHKDSLHNHFNIEIFFLEKQTEIANAYNSTINDNLKFENLASILRKPSSLKVQRTVTAKLRWLSGPSLTRALVINDTQSLL